MFSNLYTHNIYEKSHNFRGTFMNFKNYKMGFSSIGIIAFILPMIPNIFWAVLPPVSSTLPANTAITPAIGIISCICQSLMVAIQIMLIKKERKASKSKKWIAVLAIICLVGYLFSWVVYYTITITPLLLLGMAVLPSIYFVCVGLYLENYISLIPAVIFGIIHILTTAINYL